MIEGYGHVSDSKFGEKIDNEANTSAKMKRNGNRYKFNRRRALECSGIMDPLIENESDGPS